MLLSATFTVGLLVAAAAITAALGAYACLNREEPGAVPFALLMASLAWWSLAYAGGLLADGAGARLVWAKLQWLGIGTVYVGLLLFALEYTGHDTAVTRRTVAAASAFPAAVVLAAWTNTHHHLLWETFGVEYVDGLALVSATFGPLFWVNVVYGYAMVAVAAALFLRLIFVSDYLYADQSVLLLVGIAAPFVANVADVFGFTPSPGVDYTPHAFTVTGIALGVALFRRRLFDLVPATRQLGRTAAVDQLEAGVVIVDTARRVVYCNAAAGGLLGLDPAETLGREVRSLVDEEALDFGPADALAELESDGATYEIRTSPITDRRDRLIGHTIVARDITARLNRERRLAAQRDELAALEGLNGVIRGVNRALVSATSWEEIRRALADRMAASDRYRCARVGDVATWVGDADRWVVAGEGEPPDPEPPEADLPAVDPEAAEDPGERPAVSGVVTTSEGDGTWTVVPLAYGGTVYGGLGLYTDREGIDERERTVLAELGETVGHAVDAAETQRLLAADAVVELEIRSEDGADPLVVTTDASPAELTVTGLVPGRDDDRVAYVRVEGGDVTATADRLAAADGGSVRVVREDGSRGLLAWEVGGDTLLGTLPRHGAKVRQVGAEAGTARYELEVAAEADVRSLVDHVGQQYPDTWVAAKRERDRPVDRSGALPGDHLEELTDRQQEALEAAYRAGYFNWPRDSTAEEVAESLDISSPTLHSHLRKAQASLFDRLLDSRRDDGTE
jgi:PAS domain-containing protein